MFFGLCKIARGYKFSYSLAVYYVFTYSHKWIQPMDFSFETFMCIYIVPSNAEGKHCEKTCGMSIDSKKNEDILSSVQNVLL